MNKKIITSILMLIILLMVGCSKANLNLCEDGYYYAYHGDTYIHYIDENGVEFEPIGPDGKLFDFAYTMYSIRKGNGYYSYYHYENYWICNDEMRFKSGSALNQHYSPKREVIFYRDYKKSLETNGYEYYDLNYNKLDQYSGFLYGILGDGNNYLHKGRDEDYIGYIVGENAVPMIDVAIRSYQYNGKYYEGYKYANDNRTRVMYFTVYDGEKSYLYNDSYELIRSFDFVCESMKASNNNILFKTYDGKRYEYNLLSNELKEANYFDEISYLHNDTLYIDNEGYLCENGIKSNLKVLEIDYDKHIENKYYEKTNGKYVNTIILKDEYAYYRYDINSFTQIDKIMIEEGKDTVIDVLNNKLANIDLGEEKYKEIDGNYYIGVEYLNDYKYGENNFYKIENTIIYQKNNQVYRYDCEEGKVSFVDFNGGTRLIFNVGNQVYMLEESLNALELSEGKYDTIDYKNIIKIKNKGHWDFYDINGDILGSLDLT